MQEVAPGLRRWTVHHDTDRHGLVLIDPPAEVARPAHVLVTVFWHHRSIAAVGAPRVWRRRLAAAAREPRRWLGTKPTHADLRRSLAPLLELPVERVLVSHGAPVLRNGAAELRRVLRRRPAAA